MHEVQRTGEEAARRFSTVIFAIAFHLRPCKGILSFWGGLNETGETVVAKAPSLSIQNLAGHVISPAILTLMIPVLSSHGASTTRGFFSLFFFLACYVDVIEIILALVYLMTAKCYVLSMTFLLIVSVGTVTKVFYLSSAFPLMESNFYWQRIKEVINILSLLSLRKLLRHSSAKWSAQDDLNVAICMAYSFCL